MRVYLTLLVTLLFIANTTSAQTQKTHDCPDVKLIITLAKKTYKAGDDIIVEIALTNNSKTRQKFLFDKIGRSGLGPWSTSVSLIDVNTSRTVVKYSSKRILESQIYSKKQLRGKYRILRPGQSLKAVYSLYNIGIFKSDNNKLAAGTYKLCIWYCDNTSNPIVFTVQ